MHGLKLPLMGFSIRGAAVMHWAKGNAAAAPVDPEHLTVRGATVTLLACGRD
jgi:hypothetical protein